MARKKNLNKFLALVTLTTSLSACNHSHQKYLSTPQQPLSERKISQEISSSNKTSVVSQVASFKSLLEGNYDGVVSFGELKKHGDFGLGAFNQVGGEFIIIDGDFYNATSDLKAHPINYSDTTPFSTLHFFKADQAFPVKGLFSFKSLGKKIDSVGINKEKIYGVRITGKFDFLELRALKPQSKPYRKLMEVLPEQTDLIYKDITGTLIGYYTPNKYRDITVPGYHYHFISGDKKISGHVRALVLSEGIVQLDKIEQDEINMIK